MRFKTQAVLLGLLIAAMLTAQSVFALSIKRGKTAVLRFEKNGKVVIVKPGEKLPAITKGTKITVVSGKCTFSLKKSDKGITVFYGDTEVRIPPGGRVAGAIDKNNNVTLTSLKGDIVVISEGKETTVSAGESIDVSVEPEPEAKAEPELEAEDEEPADEVDEEPAEPEFPEASPIE